MMTHSSITNQTLRTPVNVLHSHASVDQKITRHRRETTPEPEPQNSSRESGDKALAALYGQALLTSIDGSHHEVMVENIPPHSTFGQWWAQLGRSMESRWVKDWLVLKNADMSSVKIKPESGEVSFRLKGQAASNRATQTYGLSDARWAGAGSCAMEAGKVVAAGYPFYFQPPFSEDSSSAPLWLVKRFYGEKNETSNAAIQERGEELIRDKTFVEHPRETFAQIDEVRSEANLDEQKTTVADKNTWLNVTSSLKNLVSTMESGLLTSDQTLDLLKNTRVQVEPQSTYPQKYLDENNATSLEQYITQMGWDLPKDLAALKNLATALFSPHPQSPPHGNYGGALAWPSPLDDASEQRLKDSIRHGKIGNIDLGTSRNVLDYLMQGRVFDPSDLKNPRAVLDSLIQSPKGKALGEAIQAKFDALSVKGSAEDWLMTALSLYNSHPAIPMSAAKDDIPVSELERSDTFGRSAQVIVSRLVRSLVDSGAASSPENARVQAHLLLSTRAPEYLVKDIPEKVSVGSHSWVSFTTAVARLEAKAPGSTASMTYADVMLRADIAPISYEERMTEGVAQENALKHWGLANGLGYPKDENSMKKVRDAYNAQISELKIVSESQDTTLPVAKEIALAELKKALPNLTENQLEEKCLTLEPYIPDYPGPYSVLDLYLKGKFEFYSVSTQGATADFQGNYIRQDSYKGALVSSSADINITEILPTLKQLPNISTSFKKEFSEYSHSMERTTTAQVKHLIATQPLDIRRDFEFGKIRVFREDNVTYAPHTGTAIVGPRTNTSLLVNIEREGKTRTYEIDLKEGRIFEREGYGLNSIGKFTNVPHVHQSPKKIAEFRPDGYHEYFNEEHRTPTAIPDSFNGYRTHYIADAFKKHMNIEGLRNEAQGLTTFDVETPFFKKVTGFFLDLIPLKSAISNFAQGDILAGVKDLAFDAFGFAVGIGAAARGAKALRAGVSLLSKGVNTLKILGRAAVGSLNPFDGLGDLAVGVVKRGANSISKGFRTLRYGADINGALFSSRHLDTVSFGASKVGSETVQSPAIYKNNDWHAYNPNTRQAYGRALQDFKPSRAAPEISHDALKKNWETLHARPENKGLICYEASMRVGQAEKTLAPNVFDAVRGTTNRRGGSNYSQEFLDIMGIQPSSIKKTFNPADISESGLINFKHANEGGAFGHTVYIQKTHNNELFIFNTNSATLDIAMAKAGHTPQIVGGMAVYNISNGNHKGLQSFLDGVDGKESWQFAYTPASTLNANVQKLKA